jgi:hypothetical protein
MCCGILWTAKAGDVYPGREMIVHERAKYVIKHRIIRNLILPDEK